jgi:UDP:flavonoid glycosyltransferase YjiC (YdhE family)
MRYLFTTLNGEGLGLLARALPIAGELAGCGHKVAFCGSPPSAKTVIAKAGFENLRPRHPMYYIRPAEADLSGIIRTMRSEEVRRDFGGSFKFLRQLVRVIPWSVSPRRLTSNIWNVDHLHAMSGSLSANYVRSDVEALLTVMTDWNADVIVDFWNPHACIAARATRKPLITVIQADVHPESAGFIWWKQPPPHVPTAVPVFNEILASYNLPPIRKTGELLTGDLTLVLGTPELDPLPRTARVTYVGPLSWQKADGQMPDSLNSLSKDKPVIWLYPGNPRYMPYESGYDSAIVARACVAALSHEDVQVVLSTGNMPLADGVLPLPANFIHEPYVPALAMAKRCHLMIHHGGYGSCQTGLYTGTPQLIIPTMTERESNARRVAAVGAGDFIVPTSLDARGRKKRVPIEELRAKVKKVLGDPSYKANAMRISEKLQSYGGPAEAARLIEEASRR